MSNLVLVSREEKENYLMHYRTKDSKNGVRRYQTKDGKLTPEGYQHYKEMYGWGEKKLGKLARKADVNEQAKDAERYNKNTKKALGVAGALGSAAATSVGLTTASIEKHHSKANTHHNNAAYLRSTNPTGKYFDTIGPSNRQTPFTVVGDEPSNVGINIVNPFTQKILEQHHRDAVESLTKVRTAVGASLGAGAVGALGVAAYNKTREKIARNRMTEVGHNKAVAKYNKQYDKLAKQLADTPFADLLKEQHKKL